MMHAAKLFRGNALRKGFGYGVFSQVTNLKIEKHSSSLENNLQEHVFEIFDGSFLKILHICCRRTPKIQILIGTATAIVYVSP